MASFVPPQKRPGAMPGPAVPKSRATKATPPRRAPLAPAARAAAAAAPPEVSRALAEPGRALEPAVQASMEAQLGAPLEHVRIHTGPAAARSARAVHAAAYATGSHVVFGAGLYAPHTVAGRALLAH